MKRWNTTPPPVCVNVNVNVNVNSNVSRDGKTSAPARAEPARARGGDTQPRDERNDHREKHGARPDRAEPEAAVRLRLRQEITERRAERAREDVREPEREHAVHPAERGRRDKRDRAAERDDPEPESEAERLGREIARRRAERERQQDRGPVEPLAARRDDRMDRQRALAAIPERERRRERGGEKRRADVEADAETVGERVGDLRTGDADEDDVQPVDPWHIGARAPLQRERADQQAGRQRARDGGAEPHVDGEIIGAGLPDRRRHDLDDPERERDFRDFVEHACDGRRTGWLVQSDSPCRGGCEERAGCRQRRRATHDERSRDSLGRHYASARLKAKLTARRAGARRAGGIPRAPV
ncbi:hypothetical protein DP42_5259 [Burkholderia pseudomallei]|nr:hypothetical protein DP42_5259 [Burkholderia pseudomallei]